MHSVTNRTRLAEKPYREKLKKDKKEIRLKAKKQHKKTETVMKNIESTIINYKNQKRQNFQRKNNMS